MQSFAQITAAVQYRSCTCVEFVEYAFVLVLFFPSSLPIRTHTHTWFKMVCAQSSSSMSSSSKGSRTLTSFSVNRSTNPSADRETAELYVPVYIHTDLVCRSGNYSRVISVIGQFGKYVLSKAGYWSSGTIFIFYFFYLTRKIPMRLKTYFSRETFNEII